ncbi:MAG: 50S ribosomal protein L10 [Candidatus Colwellbacteria bacterium]|nr:50S ribosomal protein L10 [Candidatus Colwellbacteria bacterium]
MLTKKEKNSIIDEGVKNFGKSRSMVFIDFTGVKTGELNNFRKVIRGVNGELSVIKKKLLRVAFDKAGIDFNPETFESQVGTIMSPEDVFTIAGPTVKFQSAKVLGGYDLEAKRFVPAEEVIMLGKLPSKEILISQFVGMVASPIRSFMFVLKERAKQIA